MNTSVNICGVELKNPVMTASGTFGSGQEYGEFVDKGIYAEDKNNTLYLFITKDQLMNLKMENNSDYILYLADRSEYEGQNVFDRSEYKKENDFLDKVIIIK